MGSLFFPRRGKISRSGIEFQFFKLRVGDLWKRAESENLDVAELKGIYGVFCENDCSDAVRIICGNRPIGNAMNRKSFLTESGGQLVYSIASTGEILTAIFPCNFEGSRQIVDCIVLRVGFMGGVEVLDNFERNLRSLRDYTIYTSNAVDCDFVTWLRVKFMLFRYPVIKSGDFQRGVLDRALYNGAASVFSYVLSYAIKMSIVFILIYLGLDWLFAGLEN